MTTLNRGQKLALDKDEFKSAFKVDVKIDADNINCDVTCFGLDSQDKLSDDRYMIFYNQKASPEKAIELLKSDNTSATYLLSLNQIPSHIEKLVFTITIDGTALMRNIRKTQISIGNDLTFVLQGSDFEQEKAIMFVEIYKKSGVWRLQANGQGFNGGLSALLAYFGGKEAPSTPTAPAVVTPPVSALSLSKINLDKKIEAQAPHLISLVKKANITLEKKGLSNHRARCALCLDISASMDGLYRNGKVQALADRVMALATRFDDDGELDVFLFGEQGHHPAPMQITGCASYVKTLLTKYPLEGGTRYHTAMKLIREHYFGSSDERNQPLKNEELPVYIMFITDGGTSNPESTVMQLRSASYEPMFWQFMGLGRTAFTFLERLDDLSNRFLDNADFFPVQDLDRMSDDELFGKMMTEYPEWLKQARAKGLIV